MSVPSALSRRYPEPPARTLGYSFLVALAVEAILLTALAWQQHWLAHPINAAAADDARYVEAQIFEIPPEAKLTAPSPTIAKAPEPTISKEVGKGRKAKPDEKITDQNKTEAPTGPDLGATHGPVPVFNPAPVLPAYLQNQDINTAVVIEFLITGQGEVTPRLLTSSGNDELDAIAVAAARRWKFRPAEQNHKPIDTKIRLRILFEVK